GALMNWPAIFLGCFIVGSVLSALSFASSTLRLHVHLPFVHQLHLHVHAPHALHAPHVPHAAPAPGAPHGGASAGVSPVSFPTLMAFLAWFGGTGYLLTSQFRWLAVPALVGATLAGLSGAAIVFLVMAKLLWSPDENMRSGDFAMVGVIGRVAIP